MTAPVQNRHERMVETAVWLAEQGFADIGWAPCSDGKAPNRRWKSDATDDPALVVKMLHPGRNALVIPKGKAAIVDADDPAAAVALEAAGMPPGFRVSSPTPGHGHFYVWQNGAELPTNFAGGEVRRGGSGMVLGPWALRTDGVYTPNASRVIPELPASVADTIVKLRREKQEREGKAHGPADPGWQIIHGRHDYLVRQGRKMRGDGLTGGRLVDELLRLRDERCAAPGGRVIEDAEVTSIVEWTMTNIEDDPPPITINLETQVAPRDVATWPAPPDRAAFYGLPGRIVEFVEPFSEADPVAVLGSVLTAFGCALNSGPHAMVGAERHPARLFLALVGRSSTARKGSSWSPIRELMYHADPEFIRSRLVSGLGSGEGLIHRVRDGDDDKDQGERDKRALVFAPEFATILRVMGRQGSILSGTIKEAFDTGNLENAVKTNPMKATGAHVAIIAHTTAEEMARELTDTDARSGFGNRFIYLAVRRSKLLPSPPRWDEITVARLAAEIERALDRARHLSYIERDAEAGALWDAGYAHLTRDRFGLAGILTSRAEALVLRLSLVYALTDGSREIRRPHLDAALALWEYAERSAHYIFGDRTGDPVADRILDAVADGRLSRTQINDAFGGHVSTRRIEGTLARLASEGRIARTMERTPGRSVEWIEPVRSAEDAD